MFSDQVATVRRDSVRYKVDIVYPCTLPSGHCLHAYFTSVPHPAENYSLRKRLVEEVYPGEQLPLLHVVDLTLFAKDQFTCAGVVQHEVVRLKLLARRASVLYTVSVCMCGRIVGVCIGVYVLTL